MLDMTTYWKHRREGIPAKVCARWARDKASAPEWDWAHDDSATREVDGFELRLTITYDEWGDTSYLGSFSDTWEDGAISVPREWTCRPSAFRNDFVWFVPAITVAEHRKGLAKLGYSKHVAHTMAMGYARAEMKRADEVTLYVCTVTASREGIELGNASMGGIDFGDDYNDRIGYAEDVANDLGDEALDEARAALAKLKVSA